MSTIVYGATCTWWDDITAAATKGTGLPCCPHCGGVLFEADEDDWWSGVERYAADLDDDGYMEQLRWARGRCFRIPLGQTAPDVIRERYFREMWPQLDDPQQLREQVAEFQAVVDEHTEGMQEYLAALTPEQLREQGISQPPADPQKTTSNHIPLVNTWVRHVKRHHEFGFEPSCTCEWVGDDEDSIVRAALEAYDHARQAAGDTAPDEREPTHVVAPNHHIGAEAARGHGVPTRNVIVRPEGLMGMVSAARLLVVTAPGHTLSGDMIEQLGILALKGTTILG